MTTKIILVGGYLGPLRLGWRRVDELNLSSDPDASREVLTSRAQVTVMSAQTCLQAPFTWMDLMRTRFLNSELRHAIFEAWAQAQPRPSSHYGH